MNEVVQLLVSNFIVIMSCMVLLWLISIPLKDVSFIDSFWPMGFVVVVWAGMLISGIQDQRAWLMVGLTSIWGLRLGGYLLWRWRKEGADPRYVAMLKKAPGNVHVHSFKLVFLTQGLLLMLISLPVQLSFYGSAQLGIMALLGSVIVVIGILFETIGDWQLARFRANESSAGRVLDTGLWRYTRHPNYFGDLCVWWGLFLIATETSLGWFSIAGPLALTYVLAQWSGAVLLERRMKRSRPDYAAYEQRTSAFIPWPPKKLPAQASTAA